MKGFVAFALLLLLFAALPFASWQQQMKVVATDAGGKPVPDALVSLTYQKDNAGSNSDGNATGYTDAKGEFYANISNSVQGGEELRTIEAKISTFYWSGASKTVLALSPGTNEVSFQLPVSLFPLNIAVVDANGDPVSGAEVSLENIPAKATGESGTVAYMLPEGVAISGSAAYGGVADEFSGDEIANVDGVKTIVARIAINEAQENQTDESGNGTKGTGESHLKINSLEAIKEGQNCYLIRAEVIGGRKDLPLEVRFRSTGGAILPASLDAEGKFFSRTCIINRTVVEVMAFNRLENAVSNVTLEYTAPPPPIKWNNTYVPSGWGEKPPEPTPPLALAAVAALIFVIAIGGAAYYITRKKTGEHKGLQPAAPRINEGRRIMEMAAVSQNKMFEMAIRPVIIYVRKMFFLFTRKKRKPPQVKPPVMAS